MAIRLSETIYFVRDLDRAIAFYCERLGFNLEHRYEWGFAVLNVDGKGSLALMLESAWDREYPDDNDLPRPRIALQTDNFEEEFKRLRSFHVSVGTVSGEPGGRQSVTFFDEDENACYLWCDPEEAM